MASHTPEEILEKFGPSHTFAPQSACEFLCYEFQEIIDLYDETPPGPKRVALEKRLVMISQQIRQAHCKCYPQ